MTTTIEKRVKWNSVYANFNRIQMAAFYCMKSFQLLRVFGTRNEQLLKINRVALNKFKPRWGSQMWNHFTSEFKLHSSQILPHHSLPLRVVPHKRQVVKDFKMLKLEICNFWSHGYVSVLKFWHLEAFRSANIPPCDVSTTNYCAFITAIARLSLRLNKLKVNSND